jgi:hypothetical protein
MPENLPISSDFGPNPQQFEILVLPKNAALSKKTISRYKRKMLESITPVFKDMF